MPDLSEVKTQLEAPNVTAEAVFKTGTVSEGAQRLKDKKAAKGPKEFLDAYNMNKPFEKGGGAAAYDKMGVERDPTSGMKTRTGAEATRFSLAKGEVELIESYLEKGADSIAAGSPAETAIMNYFQRAIALWPETASMTAPDKAAYIKKRLQDPRFLARVKESYQAELKKAEGFDETVSNKEAEYKRAERERQAKEREKGKATSDLGEVNSDISLYGKDAAGNPIGKLLILTQANSEAAAAKTTIEGIDALISGKNQDKLKKRAELAAETDNVRKGQIRGEIIQLDADIGGLEGQKIAEQRKLGIAQQLQQEYDALKAEKKRLEDEEFRLQGELDESKYNETRARAIYEDARNVRGGQEQNFVDGLQHVFYNAALEDISSQIKENEEFRREELDKLKEQIGDQASKTILEGIKDRWTTVVRDGTTIKKIDLQKAKIQQDYYTLLSEGPKGMLQQMLVDAKDSAGNPIFTATEIELKLNDPEYAATESEFVSALLRKRLQTAKITEGEANLLFDRFGDKVADVALSKNDKATGMLDRLKEKEGFKGSRKEFFKKMARNPKAYGGILGILALLLGSPFLIAGAGVAASGYSAAVGAVS